MERPATLARQLRAVAAEAAVEAAALVQGAAPGRRRGGRPQEQRGRRRDRGGPRVRGVPALPARELRPDDGFLGEEGGSRTSASGITWVVDPIDGTVNFLYGIPHYCVSVAAVDEDDRSLAAAVVDVSSGEVFSAARDRARPSTAARSGPAPVAADGGAAGPHRLPVPSRRSAGSRAPAVARHDRPGARHPADGFRGPRAVRDRLRDAPTPTSRRACTCGTAPRPGWSPARRAPGRGAPAASGGMDSWSAPRRRDSRSSGTWSSTCGFLAADGRSATPRLSA